ncbi:efflux RND transporter periplasmic adaptor subunit [Corallococcus sp. AS-1-12]|uniref:efflux RND transporter periplasmic adaptor subunit n=1 Tax=Corallococcus sp. AS-1-12 TaxID=2874598 RepID=UPI001CBB6349|nr:HlyD family efflux transporter periplasmic adaptor subunit [Corallococcus sp. AS-1-12]MBZ4329958.1 HlyD family efflux transporter periplasmic adaptor subunit [Corallococcus sp. AS-1-12]
MASRTSIFRKEALEHYQKGNRGRGDILRIAPGWTRWSSRLLTGALAAALVLCVFSSMNDYASGPALVRVEGHTHLAVPSEGVVATVEVQPGQRVMAGQTLVTFVAQAEESTLARVRREFELQLIRVLRDPSDQTARQALTTLRAERELAQARVEARGLRAPFDGVVGDVRIQPGQYLTPGARALSLVGDEAPLTLQAFLPGSSRPFLHPGMPLRVELDGFRYDYHDVTIESVGDQVIGPTELRRYLGAELADAVKVEGPIILVKARLAARTFKSEGRTLHYFDGMPARAELPIRTERLLWMLIPGLKGGLRREP